MCQHQHSVCSHPTNRRPKPRLGLTLVCALPLLLLLQGPSALAEQAPQTEAPRAEDCEGQSRLESFALHDDPGPMQHPAGTGPWQWRWSLGLELELLPLVLMESEWRYFPRLSTAVEWGLPWGFGLEAEASVLLVDNRFALGPSWSIDTGPVSWALRWPLGVHFGWVGVAAFDVLAWGLYNEPGLSVGVELDGSFLSLNVDVRLAVFQQQTLADWSISKSGYVWTALDSGLFVESPLGDDFILYGVELSYSEPDELLWFAFSDSPEKLLATRLRVAYEF